MKGVKMNEYKILDLFSGIGGFSLGLERAGSFRTVAFCEREPFCQAVLKKHWPEVPIYDDVKTIPTNRLGRIDLICGGFPCQPWSVAGQQRGAEDDRDLWPVMASLIKKLQPKWVIGENVRGFINEPLGLKRSLSDLEGLGYQAVPFIIPACAVNAKHRRDRVWIIARAVGYSKGEFGDVFEDERSVKNPKKVGREKAIKPRGASSSRDKRFARRIERPDGQNWLPEPNVGRVAHGVPRRVDRLKALGNAVVPQVVEQIGRAILGREAYERPETDS
jgi:DNA (cytosine-5)-methyltransferase 1